VFFDPLYLLMVLPAMALSLWASWRVKSVFQRYAQVATRGGLSGAEAARRVLQMGGAGEVQVEEVGGFLSDHYDPRSRVLRLSPGNFSGRNVAAIGVACHEAGHALQHRDGYAPMWVRSALVPVASFGSHAWFVLLLLGGIFHAFALVQVAILVFAATVVFQMVTLPVEFDASRRAKVVMAGYGLLSPDEAEGAGRVLDAAAWTYVAAAAVAVSQLLYFLLRYGMIGGRRN
jgi:Zn-dependent membrane protease YugP